MIKKNLFLILWSWRWRPHDDLRYEISQIKNRKIKVLVFEFIEFLYPHFTPAYKNYSTSKNVIKIRRLKELKARIKILEKKYNIIILNNLDSISFKGLLINYYLKKNQTNTVIEFKSAQVPLSKKNSKIFTYRKFKKFINTPLTAFYYARSIFFSYVEKKMKLFPDYLFRAGLKHYPNYMSNYGVTIKDINSLDYSNYLTYKSKHKKKGNNLKNYILYIDSIGPNFKGDELLFKDKDWLPNFTSKNWYPLLTNFFKKLERKFNNKVIIVPHPKTKHKNKPKYFGYRPVSKKKIFELIDNSKLVITRMSTAISYAIVCRKPILFIYSNELHLTENYMNELSLHINETGSKVFNINENFDKLKLNSVLKINKKKYSLYKKNYITVLNKSIPNYKIIQKIFNKHYR